MTTSGYVALTIGRGIRCAAEANPDKVALADSTGESRTYRDLVTHMNAIGRLAEEQGIGKGDVVALIAKNCIAYPAIVAGLSDRGIVVATLNPTLSEAELAPIFADCRPKLIVAEPAVRLPSPAPPSLRLGAEFDALLAAGGAAQTVPDIDERDPFAIAYTSGTTGKAKGVLLSHRSRCLLFGAMASEYGCFGRDDHFLALAPMSHGAGLAFALAPLFHGGTCTLLYTQSPEDILSALDEYRTNGLFVVPTHLHRIFSAPSALRDRYRGKHALRTIISNAAALSPTLKKAAVDYFGEGLLHETYGSTEAGIVTNIRPDRLLERTRSVGPVFPGIEVEIRRDDGSLSDAGEPGELFSRSPYTFNGYLNRADETNSAIVDGWVTVGDIAVRERDGYIQITDRKKDMVVTGGMNVYPREIEAVIESMPGVQECAVVGTKDDEWGESLHAFIVPADDSQPDIESIIANCKRRLAAYKVPKRVTLIDELPRNASGKLVKRTLREQADLTSAVRPPET